jgi:hypothetical protein
MKKREAEFMASDDEDYDDDDDFDNFALKSRILNKVSRKDQGTGGASNSYKSQVLSVYDDIDDGDNDGDVL